MISNSEITISQADMQTALAYWLNATTMREPVKVTSVKVESERNYNGGINTFTVVIERAESEKVVETKQ